MKNLVSAKWDSLSQNFSIAPLELKLFVVFTILVTFLSLIIQLLLPNSVKESIIPITGWSMGTFYGFNLIVTIGSMVSLRKAKRKLTAQYVNILLLAILVIYAIIDISTWTGGYEGNPYLFRSLWRPVWTIGVPILWIVVLLSHRIKKYYESFAVKNFIG